MATGLVFRNFGGFRRTQIALFGNVMYRPRPRLSFELGARLFSEDVERSNLSQVEIAGNPRYAAAFGRSTR